MKAKKNKYDAFSKIFAELPEESQDLLIMMGCQLLKTHKAVKDKGGKTRVKKDKRVYEKVDIQKIKLNNLAIGELE